MRFAVLFAVSALAGCSESSVKKVNSTPEVLITSHLDGDTVLEGATETVLGQVGDPNHASEDLSVTWLLDGTETCEDSTPDDEGVVLCDMTFAVDGGDITLTVRDPEGAGATARVTVDVEAAEPPNDPPTCAITGPESGSVGAEGELITFTGTADDLNVTPDFLEVAWSSDKDGDIGTSTPTSTGEVTFPYSDLSVNTHVVTMKVTDELGETCTTDTVFTVGTAPVLTITAPSDGAVLDHGEAVVFQATVSDNEDLPNEVTLSWESDIDGVFSTDGADSSGEVTLSVDSLSVGDQVVTVTATDTDGLFVAETVSFNLNVPPVVSSVTISPDPAYNDDTLVCTATATDADGGTPSITYRWTGGATGSELPLTSIIAASGDTLTCTATADDGGGTSEGSASITLGNRSPAITVSLTPDDPTVHDTLTCTASDITDPDDDATSFSFTWTVGDTPVTASSTTGTITTLAAAFLAGQTVACHADVDDGKGGTATDTASVLIGNTAPEVASVTLTPSELYTNDTVTAMATTTDADGDELTLTYAFSVDDEVVQDGSSDTLDGTVYFDKNQTVHVTVTAEDDTDSASLPSDPVTVLNTPPTAPSVSIQAGPCSAGWTTTGDGLRCVKVFDTEGPTWFEAEEACADEGGDLASIIDSSDNELIFGLASGLAGNSIWIGYNDLASEGSWEWSGIEPSGFENWRPGEPNGSGIENCAEMYHDGAEWPDHAGMWNDAPCEASGHTGGYACQINLDSGLFQWASEDGGNDHWYAVRSSSELLTWSDARTAAEAEGGHLVTLTSEEENSWVYHTLLTDSAVWILGEGHARGPYIGLYESEGAFGWVTGEDPDYFNWVPGDPNGSAPNDVGSYYNFAPSPGLGWSDEDFTSVGYHYIVEWSDRLVDGLRCTIDEESTDADGDTITYIFDWDVDGTPYADTETTVHEGDTVPDDALGTHETWTCDVTPDDGEDDGEIGSAEYVQFDLDCAEAEYDGREYHFCTTPMEWGDAEEACTGMGGHLATTRNSAQYSWLLTTSETVLPKASGGYWWIGYNDIDSEGDYVWSSGSPSTFTDWAVGEPNDSYSGATEDCAIMKHPDKPAGWNDLPCDGFDISSQGFICEVTPEHPCPGGSADISSPGDLIPYLSCTELDGVSLHMTSGIDTVSLPLLEEVHGSVYFHQNNDVRYVDFPLLRTVEGYTYFHQNYDLESISLPSLESVDRYLYFYGNELLSTLELTDSLSYVGEYINLTGSPLLCPLDLDWDSIAVGDASISGLASCEEE